MGLRTGSVYKGFLLFINIVIILSIVFLYSCIQNVPSTTSKPEESEMLVKSEKDKIKDSKPTSDMEGAMKLAPTKIEEGQDVAAMASTEHAKLFIESKFPSAATCASCHQKIYNEWASSNHAYASISPMFHKFEQKISSLAPTLGSFCVRCHASVGTLLKEPREMPLWDRAQVSREGVTCITCHRVDKQYGKVNAERNIIPGDIHQPVYGNSDGSGLKEVIAKKDFYKVRPDAKSTQRGQKIHSKAFRFEQLSKSEFCVSCHQVSVLPGIKLEVVWDQYRDSPAFRDGVTCQECHMGKTPGKAEGFSVSPAAIVAGKAINPDRKHSNHAFFGPGYTISHPGIFPHNAAGESFPIKSWFSFDWRAGWGTDDFEDKVNAGTVEVEFPEEWINIDDRYDAREIIDANLILLEEKRDLRRQVMENGSHLDGPFFDGTLEVGKDIEFHYDVSNTNSGHNLPSGSLGAQPELWLNVALLNPKGENIWESGYLDSKGDMADLHSLDVLAGTVKHDDQLFNLQTRFLTTNVKGTDREMYLPVNVDIDQLPFIRPAAQPTTVMNHAPFIRMESRSLPPLSSRKASYNIPSELIKEPGKYKLMVRMRSRAEPIYFMRFVGATVDMERAMNSWMIDLHPSAATFEVVP